MNVARKIMIDVSDLKLGDQIDIRTNDGTIYTTTVVFGGSTEVGVLFDSSVASRPMNETRVLDLDFRKSDLCKWLNDEFRKSLEPNIKDSLWGIVIIPSVGQIFGVDPINHGFKSDYNPRLFNMEDTRNRMLPSFKPYWLRNQAIDCSENTLFAAVSRFGELAIGSPDECHEVRPLLILSVPKLLGKRW